MSNDPTDFPQHPTRVEPPIVVLWRNSEYRGAHTVATGFRLMRDVVISEIARLTSAYGLQRVTVAIYATRTPDRRGVRTSGIDGFFPRVRDRLLTGLTQSLGTSRRKRRS